MKYAIPFTRKFRHWDRPDIEIDIIYKPKIKQLDTFVDRYKNHRINIYINDIKDLDNDLEIILAIRDKHPDCDLVLCLPYYKKELEEKMKSIQIPYFYNEIVTNWDKFNGFLNLNVSDIIIGEEIAFSAKILSNAAKKNHKALRFYANICQSGWDNEPSVTTFFVRPQDIDFYNPYFDTCQFYYPPQDKHTLNVLYEAYAIDKKWFGQLQILIVGYKGKEDGKYLLPEFGLRRLDCGKRCNKTSPPACSLCHRFSIVGETLQKHQLYIK